MSLHYTPNQISNSFEGAVIRELAQLSCEISINGFIAHNVLLPNVKHRYLPNEHDVILLLPHAGYTIDAKEYEPGEYMIPCNGPIEYRGPGEKDFHSVRELPCPYEIADKKAKILNGVCTEICQDFSNYHIESVIVVPDHAQLIQCDTTTPVRTIPMRLRIVKLSEIRRRILKDMREPKCGQKLEPHHLEKIWHAIGARSSDVGPNVELCGLRFSQQINRREPGCPVQMEAFRGKEILTDIDTEIRVYRKWPWNGESDRFMARMRKRLKLLRKVSRDTVPRVIEAANLPDAFVFATQWFDGETIAELVCRRSSLPPNLAVSLVAHVAQTVQHLHAENIIHLDIRPEHVWVAPALEGHGGAQHLLAGFTSPLIDDSRVSTQAYADGFDASFAAPEMQYHRHPDRSKPQNDVFSLGQLLTYCVLGEAQYRQNLQDDGKLLLPERVGGRIRDCIRMSTEPRVAARLPSVEEFSRLLAVLK
ncbi:MAG: hypothetical protein HY360_25880 [Verrucomicrobia bacterium]|nr:hypothetical protein [Verrucomicrobiota bacterium]